MQKIYSNIRFRLKPTAPCAPRSRPSPSSTADNDQGYNPTNIKNPINISIPHDDITCKRKKFHAVLDVYRLDRLLSMRPFAVFKNITTAFLLLTRLTLLSAPDAPLVRTAPTIQQKSAAALAPHATSTDLLTSTEAIRLLGSSALGSPLPVRPASLHSKPSPTSSSPPT